VNAELRSGRDADLASSIPVTGVSLDQFSRHGEWLARISHQLSAAARDKAASTSLRLLTVLDVLFQYASAR
jgi:hypothetical protein